jgi:biotin synthase-related radical SAM superfamily protein
MTKDFVKLALKMKKIKIKEFRKMIIFISCLIAKELANKKVYRFKRLSTVHLDIAKDAMTV